MFLSYEQYFPAPLTTGRFKPLFPSVPFDSSLIIARELQNLCEAFFSRPTVDKQPYSSLLSAEITSVTGLEILVQGMRALEHASRWKLIPASKHLCSVYSPRLTRFRICVKIDEISCPGIAREGQGQNKNPFSLR